MSGDSLLAFFEYPKGIAKVDRDAIGNAARLVRLRDLGGITRYWSDSQPMGSV